MGTEFHFFGAPMPDDMRKELEEQMDRHEMVADSYRHDVKRFFDELSQEHLNTLRMMLHQFAMQDDPRLVVYYEGIAAATLSSRFNVCIGCGKNHDEEITTRLAGDGGEQSEGNGEQLALDLTGVPDLNLFAQYNVEPVIEGDQAGAVRCLGRNGTPCGMMWPSLDDRMLRDPDDCSGCVQQAKWG